MNYKDKIDFSILIPLIIFALISMICIYSASTYIPASQGNLALKQAVWYLIGTILVIFIVKLKNKTIYQYTFILYIIGNILLLALLLFAEPINSSKCWFTLPGIGSFQPSEFMKLILILVNASLISDFKSRYNNPTIKDEFIFLLKSFSLFLIPSLLTFLEPDTGAVIIYLVIYLVTIFASGIRLRWFLIIIGIVVLFGGGILTTYFINKDLFIKIFGTNFFYRLDRIFAWKTGSGLQLENALASIGSAGMFGHGFNKTPIYFPESGTDFIFAVYASNFGLLGSFLLIVLILVFDIKVLFLTKKSVDNMDKYVIIGIVSMLLFQQIQNIAMTIGLLPITGITLPFISYGGSSLLSYMLIVGIILNISMEKKHKYKYKS